MIDGEDKEAQAIWDSFAAKDAAEASGAEPSTTTEGTKDDPPSKDGTTVTTAPADKASENAEATGDKEATQDIWANADPALRTAYEAMRQERDDKDTALKRVSGTVAAHQRKADDLHRQLTDALNKGKSETKDDTGGSKDASGIFDDPAFKKVEEDFPEIVAPFKAALTKIKGELDAANSKLGVIDSERQEVDLGNQSKILFEAHPDYVQIAGTPEFRAWFQAAPLAIQEGVKRNAQKVVDGREVASIVTLYKTETGYKPKTAPAPANTTPSNPNPSDKRKQQLDSAVTPPPRGRGKVHDSGPPNDGGEGDWNYWARKDRERAAQQRSA